MTKEQIEIEGLLLFENKKYVDNRGYFFENFNHEKFEAATGHPVRFVQDNISRSGKGVLRGLHLQAPPYDQGKLVSVLKGKVLDVAVDIRKNSPTYGQHFAVELSEENGLQFWIPSGFAHGFVALEENTLFCYKCTSYYHPAAEMSILWNDHDLDINWGIQHPIVSEKDENSTLFADFNSPFTL